MGQYWVCVNLDKKECIHPHKLGAGLKLWEQLANHPSTGEALVILCAAMPESRGGGDFDDSYETAKHIIGRWAGDRVAFVGDYAEDTDLPAKFKASEIYEKCHPETEEVANNDPEGALYQNKDGKYVHFVEIEPSEYKNITDDVCAVIENELGGKFIGDGWRSFKYNHETEAKVPAIKPDMVISIGRDKK